MMHVEETSEDTLNVLRKQAARFEASAGECRTVARQHRDDAANADKAADNWDRVAGELRQIIGNLTGEPVTDAAPVTTPQAEG